MHTPRAVTGSPSVCGLCLPVKWARAAVQIINSLSKVAVPELLSKSFVKYKTIVTDMFIAVSWLSSPLLLYLNLTHGQSKRLPSSPLPFLKTVLLRYNSLLGPLHRNRTAPPPAPSHPKFALDVEADDTVLMRRVWRGQ